MGLSLNWDWPQAAATTSMTKVSTCGPDAEATPPATGLPAPPRDLPPSTWPKANTIAVNPIEAGESFTTTPLTWADEISAPTG